MCLFVTRVSGSSREPVPPARMMPFTNRAVPCLAAWPKSPDSLENDSVQLEDVFLLAQHDDAHAPQPTAVERQPPIPAVRRRSQADTADRAAHLLIGHYKLCRPS